MPGAYKTEIAPELECDKGEYPSLSTGVYKNHLFVPTHKGRVCNGDPRLTIPWCEINGATLSLKRLEGVVENEYVKLQLDISSTFSLGPFSLNKLMSKYLHRSADNQDSLPGRPCCEAAYCDISQRTTTKEAGLRF